MKCKRKKRKPTRVACALAYVLYYNIITHMYMRTKEKQAICLM